MPSNSVWRSSSSSSDGDWHANRAIVFRSSTTDCFQSLLLGLGFAMVMSVVVFVTQRDLNESNYLPFFLGINVLLDHFPANPTTWYIGTYIHVLLLWALVLHKVRVRLWMVGVAAVGEIIFRAAMLDTGALFRTYMMLTKLGHSVPAGYVHA